MIEFNSELKRDLVLSIGTHYSKRRLSPIEVAEGFNLAKKNGMSNNQLADMVDLRDVTMIQRFLRLLDLSLKIRHLVDWGQSKSSISFSAASELSRFPINEQEIIVNTVLELSLTKSEMIQIMQIRKRSGKEIEKCVEETLKMRPQIVRKYVFVGSVIDEELLHLLKSVKQKGRDELLVRTLNKILTSGTEWSGRLGLNLFSLVGDEIFAKQLKNLEPDYESKINKLLKYEIKRNE